MIEEIQFDEKMRKVNQRMRELLQGNNRHMNKMVDWLLQEKGKQLRPKFMLVSADMFDPQKDVTEQAAILELIHMATLVHDDVIDQSDLRRGKSSIQKKFGVKAAVYLGDYMLFSIIKNTNMSFDQKYDCFFESIQKLCDGELGQEDQLYDLSITKQEYLSHIEGKTAALFELATYTGAILCDASEQWCNMISILGRSYGMLFQICDDLLDICSQKSDIGKPVFQDFKNGIYTLPIIVSIEQGIERKKFEKIKTKCEKFGMTKEIQDELKSLIEMGNGLQQTADIAEEYYLQADAIIGKIEKDVTKKFYKNKLDELYRKIKIMCEETVGSGK